MRLLNSESTPKSQTEKSNGCDVGSVQNVF